MCVCVHVVVCVWRSVPSPPHVGVGVKVELRLERFGSKSFPCWIMSPHVTFLSENRVQVQGTIRRRHFLSSRGSFCIFFKNCNISSFTETKFLIAFIKSPYGKLRCSNKEQRLLTPILITGRLWLCLARVHVEIQAARILTSITELRRCGSSEPVHPDFCSYSQIPTKKFFLEPHGQWKVVICSEKSRQYFETMWQIGWLPSLFCPEYGIHISSWG